MRSFRLLAVLLVPLAAGCGRKTMPVAPQMVAPAPISDLRYELDERGVTLRWTAPRQTVSGTDLLDLEGFQVLRAVVDPADYCPGCPLPFGKPIAVEWGPIRPGETIRYTEKVLRPHQRYFYKVRTEYGWLRTSRDSNMVSFVWDTLVSAPETLAAATSDRAVHLEWRAPRTLVDGSPVEGKLVYRIYRSRDGSRYELLAGPQPETSYTDTAVSSGQTYFYQVRALLAGQGGEQAGMVSETVAATPKDLTPPAPPQQLAAVRLPQGVKLVWQAVEEPDLGGYRIYRQVAGGSPELLGSVGPEAATYLDIQPPGEAVVYFVSSFDLAEPPNDSPLSQGAEVGGVE